MPVKTIVERRSGRWWAVAVAGLLTSLDTAKIEFRDKLNRVLAFLDIHTVPAALRGFAMS
ncbi:MAG: hypothetical protein EXR31_02485 [Betaproteobacteria bacterium]|nr:hypothetical protein [Betaproteobacteria bacterium]